MAVIERNRPPRSSRGASRSRDSGTSRHAGDGDHEGDRHVDEEDRAPPEVLEQPAADDRAERHGHAADGRPHADRLGPLGRIGEDVGDDGEGGGEDHRRTDAHQRSAGDERFSRTDRTGERRRDTEHDEAGDQHALASVLVAEPPGGEQQTGEHEEVSVDDPLELSGGRSELDGECRDRDIDDRAVEHRDEYSETHHGQHGPAASATEGVAASGRRMEVRHGHGGVVGHGW